MTTNNSLLTKKFQIFPLDADFKGNMRIGALINYFIQAAWQHAEELGWGLDAFEKLGYSWVLSQLKIKINSVPKWPGEITVETWPKGLNRLFYKRDANILDFDGNIIASITSNWLIIDKISKRPKLYKQDLEMLMRNQFKHAIHEDVERIKIEGVPAFSTSNKVKYTDIDINQHLTTVKYIDYIFDTYDLNFINANTPKELTINFLKEVKFGTEVTINRYEEGNIHFFDIIIVELKQSCFRAELHY